jgi:hypothetical protein
MKKRKFNDGGDVDVAAANESDDPIETMNRRKGWTDSEPAAESAPKKTAFKEAFATARKAGDKTFEWNGKKYTTDVASPSKGATSSPERKDSLRSKPAPMETTYDRMNRMNRNEASARSASINSERQTLKDNLKKVVDSKAKGYAKGGSVSSRADGIAQRGKTRGKMR